MAKAILLVRVSTSTQNLEAQEKEVYDLAIKDGYKDSDIICIAEKESAIKLEEDERNGLNRLKELIESDNSIESVYAWEISRIARTKKVLFSMLQYIQQNKIQLVIKDPYLKLLNDDKSINEAAETVFTLYAQIAESEMRNKKARFRRTRIANAAKGKYTGGFIKFGYYIDKNNYYQINEEQAAYIRLIYELYESGMSEVAVVRELQSRGYADARVSNIRKVLTSVEYTGHSNTYGFERTYPIIISKEQFERCRKIAATNNKSANKAKGIYFCQNLISCTCSRKWIAMKTIASYLCFARYYDKEFRAKYRTEHICDNKQSINLNLIDSLAWFVSSYWETNFILTERDKLESKYKSEIALLEQKIEATAVLYKSINEKRARFAEIYAEGDISKEVFQKRKDKLKEEEQKIDNDKAKYNTEIERLKRLIISTEDIASLYSIEVVENDFPKLLKEIRNITDDKIRYDIVHRQIKNITVEEYNEKPNHKLIEIYLNGSDDVISFLYNYKKKDKTAGKALENIMTNNSTISLLEPLENFVYEIRYKHH